MYAFLFYILLLQPGELPIPKDSKPYQQFGNYTFIEFIKGNWFSLSAIVLMVALLLFYFYQTKKIKEKEEKDKNKNQMN